MVFAVRGATFVKDNSKKSIKRASIELVTALLTQNRITERRVITIIFSVTEDLTMENPASAIREIGFKAVPLFCVQEAACSNSRSGTIRVLLTYRRFLPFGKPKPVYSGGAELLRPDLFP